MRTRRVATFMAFSAALGLVTTLAVAWGLAAAFPNRSRAWSFTSGTFEPVPPGFAGGKVPGFMLYTFSGAGFARRHWQIVSHELRSRPWFLADDQPTAAVFEITPHRPDLSWGRIPTSQPGAGEPIDGYEDARGWPCYALWCALDYDDQTNRTLARGGIPLSRPVTVVSRFQVLPFRPVWRGLVLDWAFYSAVWGALLGLVAWRPLRGFRRRARGQCPDCGYDLAGLTACPECGRGR